MTRHHLIAWPVGIAAILALVAVFALGHYFTCRNLPELAVQPAPGLTLEETAAQGVPPVDAAKADPELVKARSIAEVQTARLMFAAQKSMRERRRAEALRLGLRPHTPQRGTLNHRRSQ